MIQLKSQTIEDLRKLFPFAELNKALSVVEKLALTKEYENNPEYWFYRGNIFLKIHSGINRELSQIYPKALEEAYNSYLKVLEYDRKNEYKKQTIDALQSISHQFNYEGSYLFNKGFYCEALKYFENGIYINSLPEILKVDTIMYYNAAISSEKCGDIYKAISYYEKLYNWKFEPIHIYLELAKLYFKVEKKENGLNLLKQGIKEFPQRNFYFYSELINYYLFEGNYNLVMLYTEEALKNFPDTASLYFIKGSILESEKKFEEAIECYKKCLEKKPYFKDAIFNLSAIYYNKGITLYSKAKTKSDLNKAIYFLEESEKLLVNYLSIEENDETVLKMLKNIYVVTKKDENLNNINEILKKYGYE